MNSNELGANRINKGYYINEKEIMKFMTCSQRKKSNRDAIALNLFLFYLIYIFFYGIIVKFTITNSTLFTIKTYIPEITLGLCVIVQVIGKKISFIKSSFFLCLYTFVMLITNYLLHGSNPQSLFWWRDLIIPLIAATLIAGTEINRNEVELFIARLGIVAKIFLISGALLAIIEQIMGWEWTANFYTGYSFYGVDSYSKIIVNHNAGILRAASLTGNFTTFAFYSCFCLFVILSLNSSRKEKLSNILWITISLFNCLLSTNKTAILALVCILIISGISYFRRSNKIIYSSMLMALVILVIIMLGTVDTTTLINNRIISGSLLRFDAWNNIINGSNLVELLWPYNMFLYGAGSNIDSVVFGASFFDNVYLYGLVTQGIVGLLLWVIFLVKMNKKISAGYKDKIKLIKNLTYFFLLIGLTSNIIQGRAYFSTYMIMISFLVSASRYKEKQTSKNDYI